MAFLYAHACHRCDPHNCIYYPRAKAAFDIFKSTRDFFGIILFAIFGVGLCQYAYLEAIHHTNAGIATALQYLAPVMVLIISCVRRLRPPKFREIVAVLLAVGGTFLIATHGNIHQMSISKEGLKWGLLAAFGFCMYTLLPERMLKNGAVSRSLAMAC